MASIPFRVTHRRTSTVGRVPEIGSLLTGEIYIQLADELIYFKNADDSRVVTVITDASGNGLNKLNFTGACAGQVPYWDGTKFLAASTGDFITTGMTGNFGSAGGGNVDLSNYVTKTATGALTGLTGGLVSTAMTGILAVDLSSYAKSSDLNSYATNANTGNLTSVFAGLSGGYLTHSQIPNITGDICINAGSNTSTLCSIQGYPVSNQVPTIGQTLQFNGSSWVPGAIAAGGNGGGGLVYYFNDLITADLPTGGLSGSLSGNFELGRTGILTQKTIIAESLSQTDYVPIVGFVSDNLDPLTTQIPAGLFDFNVWASSNTTTQTVLKLEVYKYNGDTLTSTKLAESDDVYTYDGIVTAQYIMSIVLPQTSILSDDRLYILVLAKALGNNKNITLYFGGNTPSHVHTTIPSVGGSGLVKVINGIMQSCASSLVDSDVSASAEICGTKIKAGYFALANDTGNFVTCNQTGNFVTTGFLASSGQIFGAYNPNISELCTGSVIIGGYCSCYCKSPSSAIIAGTCNRITSGYNSVILGGECNRICSIATTYGLHNSIVGGSTNCILCCSQIASIIGSQNSCIYSGCYSSAVAGLSNRICGNYSSIIAGGSNTIYTGVSFSAILGGANIIACNSCTAYSNNFCAYNGKYYGDASALTGIATGSFITTGMTGNFGSSQTQITQTSLIATGSCINGTPCLHARNTVIVANACLDGVSDNGYLCLNAGDGVNKTSGLYNLIPSTNITGAGTFSAMIIGHGYCSNGTSFVTSMRVDGAFACNIILNQSKNYYFRSKTSHDANICVNANGYLLINITGVSTDVGHWSTKLDIIDLNRPVL